VTDAVFLADGPDRFMPTELARGPWDPNAQHGGAPAALLARAVERVESEQAMAIVRLTYEFLRPVPLAPLTARADVVRPGRRVQLVQGSLHAGDDEVARVTGLRIRADDVPAPPPAEVAVPGGPDAGALLEAPSARETSFAWHAMEIRFATGSFWEVGPAFAWFRLRVPLVAGEEATPLQRLAAAGDFGNGISTAVSWRTHVFINPDLTLYVERPPEGEWVGLDAETRLDGNGTGVSDSVLHDERGRVGRAQQGLYIAAREAPTSA
jgi:hypothetical protein